MNRRSSPLEKADHAPPLFSFSVIAPPLISLRAVALSFPSPLASIAPPLPSSSSSSHASPATLLCEISQKIEAGMVSGHTSSPISSVSGMRGSLLSKRDLMLRRWIHLPSPPVDSIGAIWEGGGEPELSRLLIPVCFSIGFMAVRLLLDSFVYKINRLGLEVQVDFFNITRQQIDDLLGKSKAKSFLMEKSIFSITIGSNDFLNNYLLPVISVGERIYETPDEFVDRLISTLRDQLTRLYSLDARKFVVGNVGPIGCIPYQKTINQIGETECVGLPNKLALQYNGRLRDLLAELNENLTGAKFILANVYDLVMELITNYQAYGFKTASAACCGNGGQFAGIIPCGPASSMCGERSKFVFWDPYHPSEAANLIIAKHLVDGEIKYISPMNIRQLKDL